MADLSKDDTVTKKDLENLKNELLNNLASKKELKQESAQHVTKEEFRQELAKLVTKEEFRQELAKVATKEELNLLRVELLDKLATKESVEVVVRQVLKNTTDIVEIKAKLNNIDCKIEDIREDIKNKFDTIIIALDKLSGEISNNRTEKLAIDYTLSRHDDRLDNHEVRIKQLVKMRA